MKEMASTMKSKSTQSKFHEGQKVKVVAGTEDPDYGFPIGGWSGIIENIISSEDDDGSWLYCIEWNEDTIQAMDPALHHKCEKDNLDLRDLEITKIPIMMF
jgi:hypothetical protein